MSEGLEKMQAEDISGFLSPRVQSMTYAGRQEDDCRARTCKTSSWPNSFRLALEQAIAHGASEILSRRLATSPQRGQERKALGSHQWLDQTQEALRWQRMPQRGLWASGSRWLGLFWEAFLLGLVKPCYSPHSQPVSPVTGYIQIYHEPRVILGAWVGWRADTRNRGLSGGYKIAGGVNKHTQIRSWSRMIK